MKLREALVQQSPSLALQRAAADEIAHLDQLVSEAVASLGACIEVIAAYAATAEQAQAAHDKATGAAE